MKERGATPSSVPRLPHLDCRAGQPSLPLLRNPISPEGEPPGGGVPALVSPGHDSGPGRLGKTYGTYIHVYISLFYTILAPCGIFMLTCGAGCGIIKM